ncbi:MAG: LytTR family DNA-binding domain-containing protein, partial [Pseudomonadota bacterium]
RIAARDHFVEVVTEQGSHRIRMRMADAVAEMEGADGMLVHRSHWVARCAIEGVKRAGAKHYVISADAELIPVSKSNLPKLEEAGLAS